MKALFTLISRGARWAGGVSSGLMAGLCCFYGVLMVEGFHPSPVFRLTQAAYWREAPPLMHVLFDALAGWGFAWIPGLMFPLLRGMSLLFALLAVSESMRLAGCLASMQRGRSEACVSWVSVLAGLFVGISVPMQLAASTMGSPAPTYWLFFLGLRLAGWGRPSASAARTAGLGFAAGVILLQNALLLPVWSAVAIRYFRGLRGRMRMVFPWLWAAGVLTGFLLMAWAGQEAYSPGELPMRWGGSLWRGLLQGWSLSSESVILGCLMIGVGVPALLFSVSVLGARLGEIVALVMAGWILTWGTEMDSTLSASCGLLLAVLTLLWVWAVMIASQTLMRRAPSLLLAVAAVSILITGGVRGVLSVPKTWQLVDQVETYQRTLNLQAETLPDADWLILDGGIPDLLPYTVARTGKTTGWVELTKDGYSTIRKWKIPEVDRFPAWIRMERRPLSDLGPALTSHSRPHEVFAMQTGRSLMVMGLKRVPWGNWVIPVRYEEVDVWKSLAEGALEASSRMREMENSTLVTRTAYMCGAYGMDLALHEEGDWGIEFLRLASELRPDEAFYRVNLDHLRRGILSGEAVRGPPVAGWIGELNYGFDLSAAKILESFRVSVCAPQIHAPGWLEGLNRYLLQTGHHPLPRQAMRELVRIRDSDAALKRWQELLSGHPQVAHLVPVFEMLAARLEGDGDRGLRALSQVRSADTEVSRRLFEVDFLLLNGQFDRAREVLDGFSEHRLADHAAQIMFREGLLAAESGDEDALARALYALRMITPEFRGLYPLRILLRRLQGEEEAAYQALREFHRRHPAECVLLWHRLMEDVPSRHEGLQRFLEAMESPRSRMRFSLGSIPPPVCSMLVLPRDNLLDLIITDAHPTIQRDRARYLTLMRHFTFPELPVDWRHCTRKGRVTLPDRMDAPHLNRWKHLAEWDQVQRRIESAGLDYSLANEAVHAAQGTGDPRIVREAEIQWASLPPRTRREYALQGGIYYDLGEWDLSAERFQAAVKRGITLTTPAKKEFSIALLRSGRTQEAFRVTGELFNRDPEDPFIQTHYIQLLEEAGRTQEAVRQLQRTFGSTAHLEKKPEVLNNLAWYAMSFGALSRAERMATLAQRAEPTHRYFLNTLGVIYLQQERYFEAEALLRLNVRLNPNYVASRIFLAELLMDRVELSEARVILAPMGVPPPMNTEFSRKTLERIRPLLSDSTNNNPKQRTNL